MRRVRWFERVTRSYCGAALHFKNNSELAVYGYGTVYSCIRIWYSVQTHKANSVSVTNKKFTLQKQKQCYPENGTSSLHSTETWVNLYQTTWRQIPEDVTYYSLINIFSDSYVRECSYRGHRHSDIVHSNKGMFQVVLRFRVHM